MYLASHRGDYLRGYRGDPGLFGALGRFAGGLARTAGKFLPGPAGVAARAVGGVLPGGRPSPRSVAPPQGRMPGFAGVRVGGPAGISAGVERYEGVRGQMDVPVQVGGGCPKGMRPNKSGYFTRDGVFHAPGSKCVKYRYRNVANGRALKRAIRRTTAFDKMVKDNRKALRALSRI